MDNKELKDYLDGKFNHLERWVNDINNIVRGKDDNNGLVTRTKILEEAMYQRRWLYRIIILALVGLLGSVLGGAIMNKAFGETTVKLGADYEDVVEYQEYKYNIGYHFKGEIHEVNFSHKVKERKYDDIPEANTKDAVLKAGYRYKIKKFNTAVGVREDKRKGDISADITVGYDVFNWFRCNAGYSGSRRDIFYSLLIIKCDFPLNKYLLYQYHGRTNFDNRWEYWTQVTIKKDLIWGIGFETYFQVDKEADFIEQERGANLTFTFKKRS